MANLKIALLLLFSLLLHQISGLKIAVLLVGEFRSWLVTRHTYSKYIWDNPINQEHDIDIFSSTYETTTKNDEEPSEYALQVHQVLRNIKDIFEIFWMIIRLCWI